MFSDASEGKLERKNELRDLPEEIVDDDGLNDLPDEIGLEDIRQKQNDNHACNDFGKTENDAEEEAKDAEELINEEINELQQRAIEGAFGKILRGDKLTDTEKGNLGEILMDQYYISEGYTPLHGPRVIDLQHKSGQGIDGVYERTNKNGIKEYVIADAKVNSSKLNKGLADGTDQMSDAWIEKRLDNAVGKEKADEIRDAYEDDPESVSKKVYHFSYGESNNRSSSADISDVDSDGNQNKDKEVVQKFDIYGEGINGGSR